MSEILTTLNEIEAWVRVNAPVTAKCLEPPVPAQQIAALEREWGVALRPEVHDLFRWHEGGDQGGLQIAPGFSLMSVKEIRGEVDLHRELASRVDDDTPVGGSPWWRREWIPIASEWNGGLVVVDHSFVTPGRVFLWDHEVGANDEVFWLDLLALLNEIRSALLHGTLFSNCSAVVEDGELEWE